MTALLERGLRLLALALVLTGTLTIVAPQEAEAACCTGRQCTDDGIIQCLLQGGNFVPGPCIPLLTCGIAGEQGACCSFLGCIETTASFCFGDFVPSLECGDLDCDNLPPLGACCSALGGCSETIETECDGFGSSFVQGASCDEGVCGLGGAQGACCSPFGCADIPSILCFDQPFEAGVSCSDPGTCQPDVGACCSDGECIETTEEQCDTNGGIFSVDASCDDPGICDEGGPGACCSPIGCFEVDESVCIIGNYVDNASCSDPGVCDDEPPLPTGACCRGETCLEDVTEGECNVSGGAWQGEDSTCTAGLCEIPDETGACCAPNGCQDLTEDECTVGTFFPDSSCAEPGICADDPDQIACCLPSGCQLLTAEACALAGGDNSGETRCTDNTCSATGLGACCEEGVCSEVTQSECGGDFTVDALCADVECEGTGFTGACCAPNGSCSEVTQNQCAFIGGTFTDATCEEINFCQDEIETGACCTNTGCAVTTEGACSGEYIAEAICDINTCEGEFGACCTGSQCLLTTEAACDAEGGSFAADTDCQSTDLGTFCPGAQEGACCVDGECGDLNRFQCAAAGGAFLVGAACGDDSGFCSGTETGACCTGESCEVLSRDECEALAGGFNSGEPCTFDLCLGEETFGACCSDEVCSETTEEVCAGEWTANSSCDVVDCTIPEPPAPNYDEIQMTGGSGFGQCSATTDAQGGLAGLLMLLGLVAVRRRRD